VQKQPINKLKTYGDVHSSSRTPDIEYDIDPEEYLKAIKQLREEILSIPID
jgi:hypothetical protein